MSAKLYGPFDELYEAATSADLAGSSDGLFAPRDPELLDRLLTRFFDDPVSYASIRGLLASMHGSVSDDPMAVRRELARLLASGGVVLRNVQQGAGSARSGVLPGVTVSSLGEIIENEVPREEERPRVRDWRFECAHHTAGARDLVEKQGRLSVVPDKGELEDLVKIHIKDEFRAPPPALRADTTQVPKSGSSDGYDVYGFLARYRGDVSQTNFLLPRFWSAYLDRTSYAISGAPNPITVEVYNPRRYKLEFKFPAMKSMKYGSKLSRDVEVQGRSLVAKQSTKKEWKREDSSWSPSTLTLSKSGTNSKGESSKSSTPDAVFDSIAFSIDDEKAELAVLDLIGAILNTAKAIQDIVDAIQENAPQVGWYMQFDFQLMQGGIALEWYWKEHTNHEVFQYIDVNLQLTILALTLELGIGISGLGFKAQVFAQLSGELSVAINGRRDDPSWAPGAAVPAKAVFKGAIGVRVEAGNFFKAEGKGETAIELGAEVGINRGQGRMLNCDANVTWTGLKVSATVRGGLFGIGGERQWERVLVGPKPIKELKWPRAEPYAPPRMSRDAMKRVVLGVITEGLNVRVIRERSGMFNDEHWTPSQIADVIADRMDAHRTFSRKGKVVEGIAHAVRQDLDNLGARSWARDYIEERAFLGYANGAGLRAHLDAAVPPEAVLAAAPRG